MVAVAYRPKKIVLRFTSPSGHEFCWAYYHGQEPEVIAYLAREACLFTGPMTLVQTKHAIDMIHETANLMETTHAKKATVHKAFPSRLRPAG